MTLVIVILITILTVRFAFFVTSVSNVSAVKVTQNLGVYWDERCRRPVYSVDWGMLSPGELKEVVVWVQNEGNETLILALKTLNWNPSNTSLYLNLTWDMEEATVQLGQVVKATLSLSVSSNTPSISNFNFDVVVEGRDYFLGDIDRDGSVDVVDAALMSVAYGSTPTEPNWNPNADLNNNSVIDWQDSQLLSKDFGKSMGT